MKHYKFNSLLFLPFSLSCSFVICNANVYGRSESSESINHVKSYSGYSVVRVVPEDKLQLDYLKDLEEEMALDSSPIEFWKSGCCIGTPTDIMVGPIVSYWFMNQLGKLGMEPQMLIDDIAA